MRGHVPRDVVPVPGGVGQVRVLQPVHNHLQCCFSLAESVDSAALDSNDSGDVEKEDDSEHSKGFAKREARVESVGRRRGLLWVLVVGSVELRPGHSSAARQVEGVGREIDRLVEVSFTAVVGNGFSAGPGDLLRLPVLQQAQVPEEWEEVGNQNCYSL